MEFDGSFCPEKPEEIDLDQTLNLDSYKDKEELNGFKFFEEEDKIFLEKLFEDNNEKEIERENKEISKLEKSKNLSMKKQKKSRDKKDFKELKFKKDIFQEKIKLFFLRAYNIISEKNYDIIIDEEDEDKEDLNKLLNLIDQILLEKQNCQLDIILGEKEKVFNNKEFIINLYVAHKILKFNDLLEIQIVFKAKIEMSIRSGNAKLYIPKLSILYQKKKQKIIMNPNFNCLLINNYLGNYGIAYCNCNYCEKCKNRKEKKNSFPFDDLLIYLKEANAKNIPNKIEFTGLYYGKFNKYRNESGYKCSFCREFYEKKLNIVKLFCNPDSDSDHTCQFWICRDCYYGKCRRRGNEICPNCGKFYINLSRLISIRRYYRWKKPMSIY